MADHSQRDVFISHEKSDGDVALELAARLRAAGYSTWCYEEDSAAGGSYLVQIDRAIEAARSMVVIISPQSLRSPHVRNEIIRAYESEKRFIPIRRGMAHDDVMRAQDEEDDDRRREWRMAFGAAVSLPWDPGDPESVAARVADGLRRQGLLPGEPSGDYVAPPVRAQRPADRGATPQPSGATGGLRMPTDPAGLQELLRAPMTRVVAAGAIGAIGALVNAQNLLGVVAPGAEQWLYQLIPLMRLLNLAANGVGLWLNIRLVRMAWRLFQGDWTDEGGDSRHRGAAAQGGGGMARAGIAAGAGGRALRGRHDAGADDQRRHHRGGDGRCAVAAGSLPVPAAGPPGARPRRRVTPVRMPAGRRPRCGSRPGAAPA